MKKYLALCLLLLLAIGCNKAVAEPPAAPPAETALPAAVEETAVPAAKEGPASPAPVAADYAISFSAQTLEGETVTEAYLGDYDLVMVNLWASWCGPCRGELAELGQLYTRLPENVGFLSITVDDRQDLDAARALLQENGCAFPCLIAESAQGLNEAFLDRMYAIPSTLFLDRQGKEVGQWIVGVPQGSGSVADAYLAEIEGRLKQVTGR